MRRRSSAACDTLQFPPFGISSAESQSGRSLSFERSFPNGCRVSEFFSFEVIHQRITLDVDDRVNG